MLPVLWVADLTIVDCHSGTTHQTVASLGVLLKALERPTVRKGRAICEKVSKKGQRAILRITLVFRKARSFLTGLGAA